MYQMKTLLLGMMFYAWSTALDGMEVLQSFASSGKNVQLARFIHLILSLGILYAECRVSSSLVPTWQLLY